ncbi:MAG: amidohydrolase [candidate division Zixibacteria bacterium]|nr:amidohydrolase [candidate division Zixibacteria bacterium]MBU1470454.1 amidohydrolase [candidate division Zixibacteria bacterium]MBU2625903.1 amidohydrolase [candidate division Zixibacteria bacterium]
MVSTIDRLADKYFPFARKLRRQLHQHPETAFEERETSKLLQDHLAPLGLLITRKVASTGFTALLKGDPNGKVAALRADMDALPVNEETGLPYRSKTKGKMHACGHDAHMSIAVGTAYILSDIRSDLKGSVKFIFQPAEETPPGGAIAMIEEGVLRSPDVDAIFGLHVDPDIPVGKIGIRDGVMMAGVVDFDLTVKGKGGHAARPDKCIDAIVVAANVVTQLQNIVSRRTDPLEPVVLTFGKISGGSARNVIAGEVTLSGTMRSLSNKTMARMKKLIENTCKHVTKASNAGFEIDYFTSYPPLINDESVNRYYRNAAQELYGKRSVVEIASPLMASEDFARFLEHIPGAMMRLGVRNSKTDAIYPWHHNRFNIDEDAIGIGMAVCSKAIYDFLES